MAVEFLESKDGEQTAKNNGIFLHSPYSPQKEAQRFVDFLSCPFKPEYVVIIEPGLSYCAKALKQKFSTSKIGVIRFTNDFDQNNNLFDFVFFANSRKPLENQLLDFFNEDKIFSVFFVSWKPSEKAYPNENKTTWESIKSCLDYAKTLLVTRQYFEKKWLLNCVSFIKHSNHYCSIDKTDFPILIAASGPSLKESIPTIKHLQEKCIIIALSSAISVLLENKITPDFCMTTDGGYWAKEHIKKLLKNKIPLAITCEADCQKHILENHAIIPLCYSDGLSASLCTLTDIPFMKAERNGTISGTALELALEITTNKIYFFGLDLCEQTGFQHTQPNELEKTSSLKDFRLNSKEKRIFPQSLKNASLLIYKNWFSQKTLPQNRVFRVIAGEHKKNALGNIRDISPKEFEDVANLLQKSSKKSEGSVLKEAAQQKSRDFSKKLLDFIEKSSQQDFWKKQLFPLDFTALLHNPNNEELTEKIKKENSRLIQKLQKILKDE